MGAGRFNGMMGNGGNQNRITSLNMAEVKGCDRPWLWPGRVMRGEVTVLAGDPGLGKSLLTLDIASRVSTGALFPDEAPETPRRQPGGVILISAEDHLNTTIRPSLEAMGADMKRITFLSTVERYYKSIDRWAHTRFCLDTDMELLGDLIGRTDGPRLIIVDPVSAFMGKVDLCRAQAVRQLLMAAKYQIQADKGWIAMLLVLHLNKSRRQNALSGIGGASSFAALARTAWLVSKDREDATGRRRLMLPIKNNVASDGAGLAFSVVGTGGATGGSTVESTGGARVMWEPGVVSMHADVAMSRARQSTGSERFAVEEAQAWLRDLLSSGPMGAHEVLLNASRDGISKRTLARVKAEFGVIGRRSAFQGPWTWFPPQEWIDGKRPESSMDGKAGGGASACSQSGHQEDSEKDGGANSEGAAV